MKINLMRARQVLRVLNAVNLRIIAAQAEGNRPRQALWHAVEAAVCMAGKRIAKAR